MENMLLVLENTPLIFSTLQLPGPTLTGLKWRTPTQADGYMLFWGALVGNSQVAEQGQFLISMKRFSGLSHPFIYPRTVYRFSMVIGSKLKLEICSNLGLQLGL